MPENRALKLNLAKIYIAAGDKAKARSELENLAKADDKHPTYVEAVALLKTL